MARWLVLPLILVFLAAAGPDPFTRGQELFGAGKYEEALAALTEADEMRPQHPVIESWIGATLINLGRSPEAEVRLRASIEHHREESDTPEFHYYMLLTQSQLNQEHWTNALATLTDYEKTAPEVTAEVQPQIEKLRNDAFTKALAKARQLLKYSNPTGALAELSQVEALKPDSPKLLEVRAVAYLNSGAKAEGEQDQIRNFESAVQAARAWSVADPQAKQARVLLGRALLGARQYQEASEVLAAVVAAAPEDCTSRVDLVRAAIGLERWDDVKQGATKVIECQPADSSHGWYLSCLASAKLQQRDETIANCDKYLARKDADPQKLVKAGIDLDQLRAQKKSEEESRAAKAEYERRMAEWAKQATQKPNPPNPQR